MREKRARPTGQIRLTYMALVMAAVTGLGQAAPVAPLPTSLPASVDATTSGVQFVGEYRDGLNIRSRYYVVPSSTTDDQLIELATQLHRQQKDAWLWFLNSGEQAKQMMDALPATRNSDYSRYPAQWVKAHTAGHTGLMLAGKGVRQWVLIKGPTSEPVLAKLPCLEKLCTR